MSAPPLSVAAQQGNEAVLRVLIEAGADVNHADVHGVTALFIATYNGHESSVRVLAKAGADVDKAKSNTVTPLFAAAMKGNKGMVRVLIEAGADVNKIANGRTPLYVACQNEHLSGSNFASLVAGGDRAAVFTALRNAGGLSL